MGPTVIALLSAAIGCALLAIVAAILQSRSTGHWPGRMFQYLMLLITLADIESNVVSGHEWGLDAKSVAQSPITDRYLIAKIPLMAVIGYAIALCLVWGLIRRSQSHSFEVARSGVALRSGIIWSFLIYVVAFSILPMVFGEQHYFHVSLIYPVFVYLALLLWVHISSLDPVVVAKQCLGLIVIGSLSAAILTPEFAIEPNYVGLIPGFDWRLWGVTAQANSLGSAACALLVLEVAEPAARRWLGVCIHACAISALLLSQSKNSIGAALVGVSTIWVWRLVRNARQQVVGGPRNKGPLVVALVATLSASFLASIAWSVLSDPSPMASVTRHLDDRAVGELATATGRTEIWSIAVQAGMDSPFFGQGVNFWHEKIELGLGLAGATHAHNLLLHAFSCAGLVGLSALVMFLYFLFRYSIRAASSTRGGSVGMMMMFLVRSMFEVPIQPNAILGAETIALMAYVTYAMDRGGRGRLAYGQRRISV